MWLKAPLVLFQYPRLLLALAVGALLLAVAVVAFPLFISAETDHLLNAEINKPGVTRYGVGVTYRIEEDEVSEVGPQETLLSPAEVGSSFEANMFHPLLGPTVATVLGPEMTAFPAGRPDAGSPVALFAGTAALDHVQVIDQVAGSGVWVADQTAQALHLGPGNRLGIRSEAEPPVELRIIGTYRALSAQPTSGYWQAWYSRIYPACATGDCPAPVPFVILSPSALLRIFDELAVRSATYVWQAPLRSGPITWDKARSISKFEEGFTQIAASPAGAFRCCGSVFGVTRHRTTSMSVGMPRVVWEIRRSVGGLAAPGRVLQAAGVAVALTVIGAAGLFGLSARRVEAQLQYSRGTAAFEVAARTVLESTLPTLLGLAAGLVVAVLLAQLAAGSSATSGALRQAIGMAGVALLLSLLVLATVTSVSYGWGGAVWHRGPSRIAQMPWEIILIGLAAVALQRLESGGAFVRDPSLRISRPSGFLLMFPILAISGLGTMAARLLLGSLRWLRRRSDRFPSWLYLAIHRLAGGRRLTLLLVAASALCIGVSINTQTVVRSLETTVDAKAGVFVGSDVRARVLSATEVPDGFPLPITKVIRAPQAGIAMPGERQVDLLAVDPTTLSAAAYWNPAFSSLPLSAIMRRLGQPTDGQLPVVVAGDSAVVPDALLVSDVEVPVDVVAHVAAFPGTSSLRPLIVVDGSSLLRALAGAPNPLDGPVSIELWVKGAPADAVSALQATGKPLFQLVTAEQVKDIPRIAATIRTFRVLNVLALVAASLAVIGMLMYLQARQRSQTVSYGLSLRMGMSHSSHRRSLVFELGMMLVFSYVIGLGLALGSAILVVRLLDPLPTIAPEPLFSIPHVLIGLTGATLLLVSWFAGWLTNLQARRVNLGELMRLAD